MFFRSEPNWEVVEPLKDIGWRLKKSFFLIKPKDQPKQRMILSWVCIFLYVQTVAIVVLFLPGNTE